MPVLEDAKNNSLCHNHMITIAMGQWMIFKTYKMEDKGEKECQQKFLFILDLPQLLFCPCYYKLRTHPREGKAIL